MSFSCGEHKKVHNCYEIIRKTFAGTIFTINFNLFFLLLSLTVNIVDEKQKIIVRRPFTIDPKGARCLCLWHCSCFCFGSFLTTEVNDLCDMMSMKSEIYARFYDEQNFEDIEAEMDKRNFFLCTQTNFKYFNSKNLILFKYFRDKSHYFNFIY